MGRPFPYISNLSLCLGVLLRDPDQDAEVLARVKVPKELLGRFLRVRRATGRRWSPLEDLIAANLESLFPGMEVLDHSFFRVTRDTDYDVSDEADDLLQAVEEELRRRRFGEVVRLEVERGMSRRLREPLVAALGIRDDEVDEFDGPLDLSDLWEIHGLKGLPSCATRRIPPSPSRGCIGEDGKEANRVRGDARGRHPRPPPLRLVHDLGRALREAGGRRPRRARDQADRVPHQRRLAAGPGLIDAAERGKQAVCMVELKARFDESANIGWAKKLEEAGVHVVYGIPALKTHCKCVLVVRREGDGVRHYVHIGTGNYNPKTARIYTDVGLFTADPEIGSDIAEMFNYLTGYARPIGYRKVKVAPFNLQEAILEEIERTIAAHSPERPARIRMKMNSLLDAPSIRALYRASQAGVRVELNVRGICALRPGVDGVSENIAVTSVVGRFLEHSRIYSFERPGEDERIYIGSADLMPRNLYNRVELLVPIEDPRVRVGAARHPRPLPGRQHERVGSWPRRALDAPRAGR